MYARAIGEMQDTLRKILRHDDALDSLGNDDEDDIPSLETLKRNLEQYEVLRSKGQAKWEKSPDETEEERQLRIKLTEEASKAISKSNQLAKKLLSEATLSHHIIPKYSDMTENHFAAIDNEYMIAFSASAREAIGTVGNEDLRKARIAYAYAVSAHFETELSELPDSAVLQQRRYRELAWRALIHLYPFFSLDPTSPIPTAGPLRDVELAMRRMEHGLIEVRQLIGHKIIFKTRRGLLK